MTTKTKKTTATRGRPKKDFSSVKIETKKTGTRGRPKKETKIPKSINAKIIDHSKDINKLSKNSERIHLDLQNTTFISKKIDGKNSKKSDNLALGLLIFSMVLFIFSLYKTFYINKNIESYNYNKIYQQTNVDVSNDPKEVEVEAEDKKEQIFVIEEKEVIEQNNIDIIKNFYDQINQQNFGELTNLVDSHLKSSNVFRTYYNKNWLSKFIENTINKKIYVTNFVKIDDSVSNGTQKYGFTIKYKLNNNNELFKEEREMAIVIRGDKKLIGSLRCTTTGCSKMPFFSPQRYDIK